MVALFPSAGSQASHTEDPFLILFNSHRLLQNLGSIGGSQQMFALSFLLNERLKSVLDILYIKIPKNIGKRKNYPTFFFSGYMYSLFPSLLNIEIQDIQPKVIS